MRITLPLFVAALLLLLPSTASAADSEFVTIDRPVRQVAIDPGSTVVETVTIKNQTTRPVEVQVATNDLAVRANGSRSPRFAPSGSQPRGAGDWIDAAPATLRVGVAREARLRLRISAPADAAPGGWQAAAILAVRGVDDPGGNIGITQEVPVLLLVGVNGPARRDVRTTITPESRLRLRGGRTAWRVRIANDGDVHESFGGRVVVRGRTGGRRTVKLEPGVLLPGESRSQRIELALREAPDLVEATVDAVARGRAGDEPEASDTTVAATSATVFVLPWWLPLVLVMALVVIVLRVRRRRRSVVEAWIDEDDA